MYIKNQLEKLIQKLPYIGKWRKVFLKHSTPGSFSSPIPDLDFIEKYYKDLITPQENILGVDLNIRGQKENFLELSSYFNKFNFPAEPNDSFHYYYNNVYFNLTDGLIFFSIIQHYKPKRFLEVGSGYSSSLIIDVNNIYFDNKLELLFIEPNPERLKALLSDNKNYTLFEKEVQFVDLDYFKRLEKNDILFIDSSHVTKAYSDVNYLIFKILPILKSGVLIHFHDIYSNFEYPFEILKKGYFWNEAYLLRAFLMNNGNYEILIMNSTLNKIISDSYKNSIKEYFEFNNFNIFSGSLWLRKL